MAKKKEEKIIAKQQAKQPIPPVAPPAFIAEAIKETKEARKEPEDTDDKILAEGAESEFWRLVKDYIRGSIKELKKKTTQAAVESGFNLEVLGFRYILMDQIENFAEDIIHYVELRRAAVEEMKRVEAEKEKVKVERLKRRQERR